MVVNPKDYIVVGEDLYLAVVSDVIESGCVLAFLRYTRQGQSFRKLATGESAAYIQSKHPGLLFHSKVMDVEVHGVPTGLITRHFRPQQTISRLMAETDRDNKQQDAVRMIELLMQSGIEQDLLGITGSLMLGAHNADSDIDILIYGRDAFFKAREVIQASIKTGVLSNLNESDWHESWQRRDCALTFEEYSWHEKRKFNKCLCGNTKVDISMIASASGKVEEPGHCKKLGIDAIRSGVIDDRYSFDYPARYRIDNDEIFEIVSYTATYTGQAFTGEFIEAAGYIEVDEDGKKRLLVGTSREAAGEYIKVLNN